jgi:hypothetical protein
MSHVQSVCGGLINRRVQGSLSEPASLIILGWLLTRRLGTQSAGFWSVMGWNLRCTAGCLVPISRRNILPPKLLVRALQGGPRHQCCQQVFGLSAANLVGLHGKGKKWIHEGQSYRARFAVTCPAHGSVPKRRDRPQRLPSRPAHKPAEQERL